LEGERQEKEAVNNERAFVGGKNSDGGDNKGNWEGSIIEKKRPKSIQITVVE